MDSCDEDRHFTLTVPRLALREPMLLNSILALASRYDALRRSVPPDLEAIQYNQKSIEWLIASFSKPPSTYGSELLAAVVMTRSYEECDFEADISHLHLSGTKDLLAYDKVAQIASRGGLAEAACWVHLRQAIYAYLVRRRPVDRHINAFQNLAAFRRTDDSSYANQIVYHFARTLRLLFHSSRSKERLDTEDTWASLQTDIDGWFSNKPLSFSPVFASSPNGPQFPALVMLSSPPGNMI
ncbi:unnamed protein product [Clonostachys solani]|uniref:Uncharacterized protein n=1 Tax=Clonostachys solani TaxID=160281 RepID=A0A9N9ZKJ5_9HYPO|nr:unnamed protein product [Clonostachys solani]